MVSVWSIAGVYWGFSQEVPARVGCTQHSISMVFLGKRLLLWVCGCKHSTYNYVAMTTRKLVNDEIKILVYELPHK